jgi:hypothetical protein
MHHAIGALRFREQVIQILFLQGNLFLASPSAT